jgi:hypothetical protein
MREGTRRAGHRDLGGGGQAPQADPQAQEAVAVVERGGRCGSRSALESILPQVRPRTHHTVPEANPQLDRSPVQAPREQADRWTWLVLAAYAQLRLARAIVADRRLPWERSQRPRRLTPTRVLPRAEEFCDTPGDGGGTPAEPPKPCGRSPGRPRGSRTGPAKRYPALKKAA